MKEKKKEDEKGAEKAVEEPVEPAEAVEDEAEVKKEGEEFPEGGEKEAEVAEGVEEAEEADETVEGEEALPPAEEEAKPSERKEKPEEEEIVEERIYTVPLGRAWIMPPAKRAPRAVRMLKSFIKKHMKLESPKEGEEEEEPKRLVISNEVNEKVWGRGIEKPPRKIRIRAAKDKEGNITVYLAEGD